MSVSQLIYLSRATQHVDRLALLQITAASSERNRARNVSGALLFCDGYFLQILEGEPILLEQLLGIISQDDRHTDVHVVQRKHNVARDFADWSMACLHETTLTTDQSARAARCIQMISDESIIDRIGNDAHQLLVDLQGAIAESAKAA